MILDAIIYSDNGVLTDITQELSRQDTGTSNLTFTVGEDYLYFGSRYPSTSKSFGVKTANITMAVPTIETWDGSAWREVSYIRDNTKVSGISLSISSDITWNIDPKYTWQKGDTEDITGLTSIKLFDMFWFRISWSATITAELSWIADLFLTEDDLFSLFRDLDNSDVLTAIKPGKTNWEYERFLGSKYLAEDLINNRTLENISQILKSSELTQLAILRTALIIYSNFGSSYKAIRDDIQHRYESLLIPSNILVDKNKSGNIESEEINTMVRFSR